MSQTDFIAEPGETVLIKWRVSLRSYVIRTLVIAFLTTGIFVSPPFVSPPFGVSFIGWLILLPMALLSALFPMWVFGELDVWMQNRKTDWYLTNRAIHIVPLMDMPARLPLNYIRKINRWPFWSLVIRLTDGTAITVPIPPKPQALRKRILSARVAATGEGAA